MGRTFNVCREETLSGYCPELLEAGVGQGTLVQLPPFAGQVRQYGFPAWSLQAPRSVPPWGVQLQSSAKATELLIANIAMTEAKAMRLVMTMNSPW